METLKYIQSYLIAPKGQFNSFGKYKYRSCEDILEAVKPLLREQEATLILSDEIINLGDRYYIKATATLTDKEGKEVKATALAREALTKKGMDDSQISGAASSYARKYALNGLFLIDDTKDADTDSYKKQNDKASPLHKKESIKVDIEKAREELELANTDAELVALFQKWDKETRAVMTEEFKTKRRKVNETS